MPKVKLTIAESKCRCGYFKKGQEFIVEDLCPPLCHELWNSIYPFVYALQNGATLDYGDCRAKMFDAACPDEGRVCIHGEVADQQIPAMKMEASIRKVQQGDANTLAYIQTESWKAAFAGILDTETLAKCTNINRATEMYQQLLDKNIGNGYILSVDGKPHCIAYWDEARDVEFTGKAELICIHSLPDNWHKGYGSQMMDRVQKDIEEAGYSEVVLWVFRENHRARAFYEAKGFTMTGISKPAFDTEEVLYSKRI